MFLEGFFTALAPLTIVIFANSGWDEKLVQEQIQEASVVYDECGIKLAPVRTVVVPDPPAPLKIHAKGQEEGILLEDFVRSLDIKSDGTITAYFVKEFASPSSAFSRADFPDSPEFDPILFNSVWLPISITSEFERKRSKNYSILAHELAHVYLLDGYHNGYGQPTGILGGRVPGEPDIMTIWRGRTNRITHLCHQILQSPLVKDTFAW